MQLFHREVGQGSPLIILHGLFGSSDNWLTIGKALGEHFKVYMIDQRNHGQTENTEEFNYSLMADDLKDFIEEHHISNPVIMGHSMGGKVVMKFILKYPEIAIKSIVVDIAPRFYPPHHQKILEGLNEIPVHQLKSRKDAEIILAKHEPQIGVRQFLLKNLYRSSSGGFDWRINLSVLTEKIENVGEAITSESQYLSPVLFIKGEKSNYILEKDEKDIGTLFPKYQLKTIANAGHWVHAEQPSVFIQSVLNFI
ncbi:alpha/beta fold hydrolase [Flexithrix dorotheae]|uniref:alpha/beta fold hydrolase n=1 Tax=Flexithrix dorotheae TaxID=70993 RepID=UPI000381312A|nr:alpha/beta fold hydrolase [Flexithrix dorotheae]